MRLSLPIAAGLALAGAAAAAAQKPAQLIDRIRFVGPTALVELSRETGGHPIEAEVPRQRVDGLGLHRGQRVRLTPRRYRVFPAARTEPGEVLPG